VKLEHSGLKAKHYVYHKPQRAQHPDNIILPSGTMVWGYLSDVETGKLDVIQ